MPYPYDEGSEGVRVWQWVVTMLVIIILMIVGIIVFGGKNHELYPESVPQTLEQQCSWYEDYPVRDLPVKCLKYLNVNPSIDASK